ncbi:FG-GAP-like repeat-containing protein [Stieleria marina]
MTAWLQFRCLLLAGLSCVVVSPNLGCTSKVQDKPAKTLNLPDAESALRSGNLDLAEKITRQVLIQNPDRLDATQLMAQILVSQDDLASAAELLIRSGSSHPDERPGLLAGAADLFLQAGQTKRSIDLLQDLVQKHPSRLDIRRQLAGTLNEVGYRFDANEHLRYLAARTALTPRELTALINPFLTWRNFADRPNTEDEQAIQKAGLFNVIAALRANGEARAALEVLQNSATFKEGDPYAIAVHGWLLSLTQRYDQLAQWAASANPDCKRYPDYWLAVGNLMLHRKNESAVDCFTEALRREPGSEEAVQGLIQSLSASKRNRPVEIIQQRKKLINESAAIARAISSSPARALQLAPEMGRVMNDMGRYAESLAWQESIIAAVSPQSSKLNSIRQHKLATLDKFSDGMNVDTIVCGLEQGDLTSLASRLADLRSGSQEPLTNGAPPRLAVDRPKASKAVFTNVAPSLGVRHRLKNSDPPVQKEFRLHEALASGVACLDFDRDGNVDLYLGQAGCVPPGGVSIVSNQMYRNQIDAFRQCTEASGASDFHYTNGVTAGDWNQDGFPDLLIGNIGVNRLMLNQGDGTFLELKLDQPSKNISDNELLEWNRGMYTMSVGIADLTGDSIPDIFETTYVDDPHAYEPIPRRPNGKPVKLPGPKHFRAAQDRLFVTSSDGKLTPKSLGDPESIASTGMGLLVTDIDGDRDNDVFVANDQNANQYWRGSEANWTDSAALLGCAYGPGGRPYACMGIAAADFDRNGRLDLHITNFSKEPSNVYLQTNEGAFQDAALSLNLDKNTLPMVGFGTQALDFDNNTTTDLIIGNGHIEDFRDQGQTFQMPTQLFTRSNNGYVQLEVAGDDYWSQNHLARSVAKLDWNGDGRIDLAITDLMEEFVLLENRCEGAGNYLQLEFAGTKSERDAIGTRVTLHVANQNHVQVMQTGDGYLCKNESCLNFGLGNATTVARIDIQWPSGTNETLHNVAANQRLLVIEEITANHSDSD